LGRLHRLGVGLAVDDFGTGYSSMAYLRELPVDELKIDRSFVSQMATSPSDAVIVRSTIDLGHNLGLRVVAEGVETQHAWQQLSALGCDIAQGYYLGRPMPAAELEQQLTQPAQAAAEIQADARPSA
jgi:EAL domain-containing protein (putative c-di-GMP-specific phosphodiesterase class I)